MKKAEGTGFRDSMMTSREELQFQPGEHPHLIALEAYSRGKLADEEQEQLVGHLAVCAECVNLLRYTPPNGEGAEETQRAETLEAWTHLHGPFEGGAQERVLSGMQGEVKSPPSGGDDEITALYEEINRLTLARNGSEGNSVCEQNLEAAFSQLRELQRAEAAKYRTVSEANLEFPIHAGKAILERVRDLKAELERSLAFLRNASS